MKITPAHDQNDYDCGKRNNLNFINIIDDTGNITAEGGQFAVSVLFKFSWICDENHIYGLVQDCVISVILGMDIPHSWMKSLRWIKATKT